jgi:hypothetical protein
VRHICTGLANGRTKVTADKYLLYAGHCHGGTSQQHNMLIAVLRALFEWCIGVGRHMLLRLPSVLHGRLCAALVAMRGAVLVGSAAQLVRCRVVEWWCLQSQFSVQVVCRVWLSEWQHFFDLHDLHGFLSGAA